MKRFLEMLAIAAGIAALILVYALVEPSKPSDFSQKIIDQSREAALAAPAHKEANEWDALQKWADQFTPPRVPDIRMTAQ